MPVKILVADDSATMRQIMQMTFAGEDAEVVTVDSGDAAIQQAKQMQPDVVFADATMPKDGYAVAQEIKGDPGLARTAVIVMASQHTPFDENRAKQAGVDAHVLKPFDTQVVIDKMSEVLATPRASATAGAPAAAPPPPAPRPAGAQGGPPPPPPPRGASPAQPARPSGKSTVAFGAPQQPPAAPPPAASAKPAAKPVLELADEEPPKPAAPEPKPAAARAPEPKPASPEPKPAAPKPAAAAAAATGNGSDMAAKLRGMGLNEDQVNGVLALSRDVIEQVVWEVVPDLAETIIREEIRRLTAE